MGLRSGRLALSAAIAACAALPARAGDAVKGASGQQGRGPAPAALPLNERVGGAFPSDFSPSPGALDPLSLNGESPVGLPQESASPQVSEFRILPDAGILYGQGAPIVEEESPRRNGIASNDAPGAIPNNGVRITPASSSAEREEAAPASGEGAAALRTLESLGDPARLNGRISASPDRAFDGAGALRQADSDRAGAAAALIDARLAQVNELSLRDGHQSLFGNTMLISEREPIARALDQLGLHSVESGGGADFEVGVKLGENPFQNLRTFAAAFLRTTQRWLFRGRNSLGLGPQPKDVIQAMVTHAIAHGLGRVRVFDGMNDVENVRSTVEAVLAARAAMKGADRLPEIEGALAYTVDPPGTPPADAVWTADAFVAQARAMKDMGVHAIAIKDMAGALTEEAVVDLVTRLHREVGLPIVVHSHSSTGRAPGVLRAALATARRIGADMVVDAAIGELSGGTSHPDLRHVLRAELADAGFFPEDYRGSPKMRLLDEIAELVSRNVARLKAGQVEIDAEMMDLLDVSGIPGGMIGTTANMLRPLISGYRQKLGLPGLTVEQMIKEGLRRVPGVRRDAGLPPLVTPMSQFVLVQAINNYLEGDYAKLNPQYKAMMKGRFGKVRGQVNLDLLDRVLKEDLLIQARAEAMAGNAPSAAVQWLAGTVNLGHDAARVRALAREALSGSMPEAVLERILRAGEAGPPEPLAPGLPALLSEAKRYAFKYALDVADPLELSLLLVAKDAEKLISAPPAVWKKVVGTRPDGFPIVYELNPAWTRPAIEQALNGLPKIIGRGGRDAQLAREEAARILSEELGLEGRALVMGRIILDELVDRERASPGT